MNKEGKCIISCLGPDFISGDFLNDNIDWNEFLKLGRRHNVLPVIHYNLARSELKVPQEVRQALEKAYIESNARALFLCGQLTSILRRFNSEDIPVIIFKGPSVAETLYPKPGLRPFDDLDLLILKKDLDRAEAVMKEMDFVHAESVERAELERQHYGELGFVKRSGIAFSVEIHWDIINSAAFRRRSLLNMDRLWENKIEFDLSGGRSYIFPPHDLFISLCLHMCIGHQFDKLVWLYDLVMLLHRYGTPSLWDEILKNTREHGIEKEIYYSLYFLAEIFRISIPPYVFSQMKRSAPFSWVAPLIWDPDAVLSRPGPVRRLRQKMFREFIK